MTIVRPANFSTDALAIIEGARAFADSTSLKSWFRTGKEFVEDISKIMTLENVEIMVAEHEGVIVGGIGIAYIPFIWNQTLLVGDELFWWAAPGNRLKSGRALTALFDKAMQRIEEKGAIPMFRCIDTSPERMGKFYERNGLFKLESAFTRVA